MITGPNDQKLSPVARDVKAPFDSETPPAYSERLASTPLRGGGGRAYTPRQPTGPAPPMPVPMPMPMPMLAPSPTLSSPLPSSTSKKNLAPAPPSSPAPPPPPPQPIDAASYHASTKSGKSGDNKITVGKAMGQGLLAIVAAPVVAAAAVLYGSGKLVEGIGKGISAGPAVVLKAYKRKGRETDTDKDEDKRAGDPAIEPYVVGRGHAPYGESGGSGQKS